VSLALLLAAHSPLARSQEQQRGSVGRGWPIPVVEFGYVGGDLEGEGQQAAWDGRAPAVVLHFDQPNLDDPVTADAGVPRAHGADALPPVR